MLSFCIINCENEKIVYTEVPSTPETPPDNTSKVLNKDMTIQQMLQCTSGSIIIEFSYMGFNEKYSVLVRDIFIYWSRFNFFSGNFNSICKLYGGRSLYIHNCWRSI
jgi:hypothetical protein